MMRIYLTFITILLLVSPFYSQINIFGEPQLGFDERIENAVNNIKIIDTHEHLQTEEERLHNNNNIDFTNLFRHYAKEDLISASNNKGLVEMFYRSDFTISDRWELFYPFYKKMRNTGYGRVALIAARNLFGVTDINANSILDLSIKMKEAGKQGYYHYILKEKANIDLSIMDMGHRKFDQNFYRHVERFDQFIQVSSKSEILGFASEKNIRINNLSDYVMVIRKFFEDGIDYGMVGVKSGLAYSRILKYNNTSSNVAETIFNKIISKSSTNTEEIMALQDYLMHQVLDLVDEYDIPIQIHTGLQAGNGNTITNSNPVHLSNLFMEYPEVDFCLFHGGYPYGGELATLAKNFPNVFIDLCWIYVISPSYSERYLHEWLETVPANKILAFGGDYDFVEGVYAHSVMARQVIANVLTEKVRSGYLNESEAIDIAKMILRENALNLFKINGHSRSIKNIDVLNKPGPLNDWWRIHKSNKGFVTNWKVIGPFNYGAGLESEYPPEVEIIFDKKYLGLANDVYWKTENISKNGYLNFVAVFGERFDDVNPRAEGIAYAYTELTSPDEREVNIAFGSNDGAKVWINNKIVYNLHVGRNAVADLEVLNVMLSKGVNKILVKVENLGANWGLFLRIIDPENELKIEQFN